MLRLDFDALTDVMKIDLACIMHEGSESKSLSARPSAVVENDLLRLGVDAHGEQLAGLILHLEVPLLELSQLE